MHPPDDEIKHVAAAASGLLYPSETDAPLTPFRWPAGVGATAGEAVRARAAGADLKQISVDEFFAELIASDEGARWVQLRNALNRDLSGVEVWHIGSRR